jgi:hypothetical protein
LLNSILVAEPAKRGVRLDSSREKHNLLLDWNDSGSNAFCGSASECNVCYEIIYEFSGSGMT